MNSKKIITRDTHIEINGATENNLRNISLRLPHYSLIVITGVSGSGKSSLAYDTLYNEGQRRFIESLSPYARQFLGNMEKPKVKSIEGISPAVCIDQKRRSFSSRSTVGTITAIYDYLRLLFARLGTPHCPKCLLEVSKQNPGQIARIVMERYGGMPVYILAPMVVERKGEYRREFAQWLSEGFVRVRVNGKIFRLDERIKLDRYEKHTLELVIDHFELSDKGRSRLLEDIECAVRMGEGMVAIATSDPKAGEEEHYEVFSVHRACPQCGFSLPELEPRLFSFNNPQGACQLCNGRGTLEQFDPDLIVKEPSISIAQGALDCFNKEGKILFADYTMQDVQRLFLGTQYSLQTPWNQLPQKLRHEILMGSPLRVHDDGLLEKSFPGIVNLFENFYEQWHVAPLRRFIQVEVCPSCNGDRLTSESLHVLFAGHNIAELAHMQICQWFEFLDNLQLNEREQKIGREIFHELRTRCEFLAHLGLSYLTLDRNADTLAGGEMQRIRLARQLGAGLQGILYILDEPSVGLHSRDNGRLLHALGQLRDLGNTVVIIEHDEETMRKADHIIDMGPGAGSEGGEVVAQGKISQIQRQKNSLTGQYLSGHREIPVPITRRMPGKQWLKIVGASEHNLKNIDVKIPLGLLVAVTGVSGSGKSTLVDDILYRALARLFYKNGDAPGKHKKILGTQFIKKVVVVDQSPIGNNPRSNPATYVRVFDEIRNLFAIIPESKARGYLPGRFSFNVDEAAGRCPRCKGMGYREIEMQFLPSVWIPCEQCEGRRFNRETLEIQYRGKNIADILDMTVAEAYSFFENHTSIARALKIMLDVGMGYVKLGQPSPNLSGGEAQRIKLVRELQRGSSSGTIYILDEPTTGLHFADIELLLQALQQLVDNGNTVVVIEHHLDVIKMADWIIDLGPEGGEQGGEVIVTGTPEEVMTCSKSYTGQALHDHLQPNKKSAGKRIPRHIEMNRNIIIQGAVKHNLKNIHVEIPWQKLTVVTGISGSGKSTLVMDTLFAEGQRTFLESLSTYARRFLGKLDHGEVDSLHGLAPAIAIDQKTSSCNPRSTVATMTEIYDYLRILYARIGVAHCPTCHREITQYSASSAAQALLKKYPGVEGMILAPLYIPGSRKKFFLSTSAQLGEETRNLQSKGFTRVCIDGKVYRLDALPNQLWKRNPIHLVIDRITIEEQTLSRIAEGVQTAFNIGNGVAFFFASKDTVSEFSTVPACVACDYYQTEDLHPRMFSFNHYIGECPACRGLGFWETPGEVCQQCHGKRLKPEYLAVTIGAFSIGDFCSHNVSDTIHFLDHLLLSPRDTLIAHDALKEIRHRLEFLQGVGLEYLTLDRRGETLSGGEAQRIRLATQIGNRLLGVIYVMDEPTVGLHQRDTARLLSTLRNLVNMGNTVVMVEHDPQCIAAADHIIDMGPGAGHKGGGVVACGTPAEIMRQPQSLTGQYLSGKFKVTIPTSPYAPAEYLEIHGASLYNLKNIDVAFPLKKFTAVTGVSGSGKSTLVVQILQKTLHRYFAEMRGGNTILGSAKLGFAKITKSGVLQRLVVVDQTPLARTPSSNLATYCDIFNLIRDIFVKMPTARMRGFKAGRFSFNRPGGRCEVCEGKGVIEVNMHFLSDVWITCEACNGKRYMEETLSIHYKGKNIAQVLEMDVVEATDFFSAHPQIVRRIKFLKDIGLGYMRLGQCTNTLSGGEAQRLKLARELSLSVCSNTLYIMDEPTTGLHAADIQKLLDVIHRLVIEGNTVIVIEHNLDVISCADWIIDLGPEGGDNGGQVVCAGTLKNILSCPQSHTGSTLKSYLPAPSSLRSGDARSLP